MVDLLDLVTKGKVSVGIKDGKGRCGISNERIGRGQEICSSFPYIYCISIDKINDHCHQCLKPCATLQRCSACHRAKYCSKACQKTSWKYHRLECPIWKKEDLWKSINSLSFDDASTVLLTIRVLAKKQSKKIMTTEYYEAWEHVHSFCGKTEQISDADQSLFDSNTAKTLAYIIKRIMNISTSQTDCEEILVKMQKNNFQIVDDLFRSLGGAVYPLGALLNHSCEPNCILLYEYNDASGTFLQVIRTLRTIECGEELTHAYVDAALTTPERNARLYRQYEFYCTCHRCGEADWQHKEFSQTDLVLMGCYGKEENEIDSKALKEAESQFLEAQNDAELTRQIELFENCLAIRLANLHPLSLSVFMVHCRLLDCYLERGDTEKAIYSCLRVCESYEQSGMYGTLKTKNSILYHPLIGLQFYTLGDLILDECQQLRNEGKQIEPLKLAMIRSSYTKACDILRVTHGAHHHLVQDLEYQLE